MNHKDSATIGSSYHTSHRIMKGETDSLWFTFAKWQLLSKRIEWINGLNSICFFISIPAGTFHWANCNEIQKVQEPISEGKGLQKTEAGSEEGWRWREAAQVAVGNTKDKEKTGIFSLVLNRCLQSLEVPFSGRIVKTQDNYYLAALRFLCFISLKLDCKLHENKDLANIIHQSICVEYLLNYIE